MNPQEIRHRKQEKWFRMLFVAMCLALGVLYYQTFFVAGAEAPEKAAACDQAQAICVLGPDPVRTVNTLVPGLCCGNRK